MSGLLQHDHDRGHLHEREEVDRLLLVARRHAPVLLGFRPEPLAHVPLPIPVPIDVTLLLAALLRRDHRDRATRLDPLDQRLLVVPAVGDHHRRRVVRQQFLGLCDVRLLGRRQLQLDGVTESVEAPVNLGAEPAPAAAQRLIVLAARPVPTFLAPAAHGWARTAVESRIKTSRSGSRRAARIGSHRPALAHRSNRRHWLLGLPRRSGRSSHAAPVRATHRTASMNRRLSSATPPCCPRWPGSRCLIRSQSASEIACRWLIDDPPWLETRPADYPNRLPRVHTT